MKRKMILMLLIMIVSFSARADQTAIFFNNQKKERPHLKVQLGTNHMIQSATYWDQWTKKKNFGDKGELSLNIKSKYEQRCAKNRSFNAEDEWLKKVIYITKLKNAKEVQSIDLTGLYPAEAPEVHAEMVLLLQTLRFKDEACSDFDHQDISVLDTSKVHQFYFRKNEG